MVLFKVIKISKIELIPIEENLLKELNSKFRFPTTRDEEIKPLNHEMGYLYLDVEIQNGNAKDAHHVYFICDQLIKAKIVSYTNNFFKKQVKISFDGTFPDGFEESIKLFIAPGTSFMAITENELKNSNKLDLQEELLDFLVSNLLPSYFQIIRNSKLLGYYFEFTNEENSTSSFIIGNEKTLAHYYQSKSQNNKALMHLCTIFPKQHDIKELNSLRHNCLSFFIRITDTENGWPEDKDDFSVLNFDEEISLNFPLNSEYSNQQYSFLTRPSFDIPEPDGTFTFNLNFNEDEKLRYRVLHCIYHDIVINSHYGREPSKLLGYPISEQYCVRYEAERISKKLNFDDEIHHNAENWKLLLYINPYDKWFNFFDKFGDGSIYYLMKKDDFQDLNFNNTQVVVQNS